MTEIVNLPISKLKLLEKNPRKITKDQMTLLKHSMEKDPGFLQNRPVLINKIEGKNLVYAGNQRVRAAKELGWKDIPCIVDEDLDEDIMKKRVILDNKTFGEFDFDVLANEWDVDLLLECGFNEIDLVGKEISLIDSDEYEEDDKPKQTKNCPNCGHNLN